MRIRIGHERKTVERGYLPIHGRIGRKARLQRMDMPCQVLKALLDRIKARKRTKQGKMRRPDMRRDQHAVRAGLQQDLQQIPAVQAEDRSAVGMDITDPLKTQRKCIRRSEARQQDHIMHFSRFTVLFIDRADLAGKHKTRFSSPQAAGTASRAASFSV